MNVQEYNSAAWDREVEKGTDWSIPVGADERREILESGRPLEFSHTLEEQIGGQIAAGFVVTGFYEDYRHTDAPLINKYMPAFIGMKSIKPLS